MLNAPAIIRTPTIVVLGIRRAGLSLLADMIVAGFVPQSRIVFAPDPHREQPPPLPTSTHVSLYIDRGTGQLLASTARQNANEGRAPLSLDERRILRRRFTREFFRARDAAAVQFAPLYVFNFEKIIDDPAHTARRLAHILAEHYPRFSERHAALAVRRIDRPPSRIMRGRFRVVEPKP